MTEEPPAAADAETWWRTWREHISQAEDPAEFLQEFPEVALVALLQSAGEERATERNLLIAEALRRVSGQQSGRAALAAKQLDASVHQASESMREVATAVHETEAVVEGQASGRHLGGPEEARRQAHTTSAEVEELRDLTMKAEKKADHLMRLHAQGEFVTPAKSQDARSESEESDERS